MKKNLLEWSVFGVSLALIAACIGVLGYAQLTRTDLPPVLTVTVGDVRQQATGYAVELVVRNTGDRTAEAVRLEATLNGTNERAEADLQYVPYRSLRRAWVTFESDPRHSKLVVRVLGFEQR